MTEHNIHGELASGDGVTRVEVDASLNTHTGDIELFFDRAGDVSEGSSLANLRLDPNDALRLVAAIKDQLKGLDMASSGSRQHYIEVGRYLTHEEVLEDRMATLTEEQREQHGAEYVERVDPHWHWFFNAFANRWYCADEYEPSNLLAEVEEILDPDKRNGSSYVGFDEGAAKLLAAYDHDSDDES